MNTLPTSLYQCSQVRALDREAIKTERVTGFDLMMRAGRSAYDLLKHHWPDNDRITVFCGTGNNGGDGYIVAALAAKEGFKTCVFSLADPNRLTSDAKLAYEYATQLEVPVHEYCSGQDKIEGVVVDSLLGIGISGEVRDSYAAAIKDINATELPVLAIDIPSGICGDTGQALGIAVMASITITFIGLKQGLLTGDARNHTGELVFSDLDIDQTVYHTQQPNAQRIQLNAPILPGRHKNSHKGMYGHILVIAGDTGYGGAGIMAAESALLSGAGIVTLATRQEHIAPALARRPELIVRAVESAEDVRSLMSQATICIVGPGLGQSLWSRTMLRECLITSTPVVVDADGLNLLVQEFSDQQARDNWILTPHPGEAARLLGISTREVQSDRFTAASAIQSKYGGVVVLKGAGTIVAEHSQLYVCAAGNPGMSTPGMGDVLSGLVGGLLAHGLSPLQAAKSAVWVHATAGDNAVSNLGKHILATDIYDELRDLW